jgi:uncharacterized zinc-type alcohol dehydrogenase-like protein
MKFRAYAATAPKEAPRPIDLEVGPLGPNEVELEVLSCGICHSDLSMLDNDWGMTSYPLVAGHEVVGRIASVGSAVVRRKVGDVVGLGWYSRSCMHCRQCMSGDHNLCPTNEQTIVGRAGGFADRVRCDEAWATPLPKGVDPAAAGPLFCGGITVFNPIVQFGVRPTDRVGVVGIGGLGHLALQFLDKWGCEVVAFTSSPAKAAEAKSFGADDAITSTDEAELAKHAGRFDFILVTVNVTLPWAAYVNLLAPRGRLHVVGAVLEPIPVGAFPLIMAQRSISGSPLGSPATTESMLAFAARHGIAAKTEHFPMRDLAKALDHVRSGKARYRAVVNA